MSRRRVFLPLSSLLLLLCFCSLTLAQSQKKVLYCVLLDNSGSLRTQFDRVIALGSGVARQVHMDGPTSIFSFKGTGNPRNSPPLIVSHTEWSQDKNLLDSYVNSLAVEIGQTTLVDAIHSIAEQINAKANMEEGSYSRKVIVLITDGEDRKSRLKAKQLITELKEKDIEVYAIGLVQELEKEGGFIRKSSREEAVKFLNSVTKETGGRAIFPKSNKDDVNGLLRQLFTRQE